MNIQIFATFCVLFLVQAPFIHAKPEPNLLQGAEIRDGVVNDAVDIFRELMAIVDKAFDDARHKLNATVEAVNRTVIGLEDAAHEAIKVAMEPIIAEIKEQAEKAVANGTNITTCEHYIDDLNNLPINLNDELVLCTTTELFEIESILDDFLANLQAIERDMANFTNRMDDCHKNLWTELECLAELTAEMAKDSIVVPAKVAAAVAKTIISIQGSLPQFVKCYSVSLAKVPVEGQALKEKFSACVGQLKM